MKRPHPILRLILTLLKAYAADRHRHTLLLERLCEGVERLTPPAPDTEVSIDFVEEVPDLETEEKDESAALEEFEREQQEEYEEGILAMSPVEYERFVRSTGSDPRKRIVESRRKRGKSNGR